jgi:hypothetical protein
MWCVAGPERLLRLPAVADLHRIAPGRAIFHLSRWNQLHAPLLPTALIYEAKARIPADVVEEGGPHRIVLVAEDAHDPRHGTALLRDYHTAVTQLEDLLERT